MPGLFPTASALSANFTSPIANPRASGASRYQARTDLYQSWNITEDAKQKTAELSSAAKTELSKATDKVGVKTGGLELYSKEFYASATFGGLMACGLTHWSVTVSPDSSHNR